MENMLMQIVCGKSGTEIFSSIYYSGVFGSFKLRLQMQSIVYSRTSCYT